MPKADSRRTSIRKTLKRGALVALLTVMSLSLQGCAILGFLGQILGAVAPLLGALGGGGGGGGGVTAPAIAGGGGGGGFTPPPAVKQNGNGAAPVAPLNNASNAVRTQGTPIAGIPPSGDIQVA